MQPGYNPNQPPPQGAGFGGYSSQPGTPYNYGAPPQNPSMYNGGGDVTYVS